MKDAMESLIEKKIRFRMKRLGVKEIFIQKAIAEEIKEYRWQTANPDGAGEEAE